MVKKNIKFALVSIVFVILLILQGCAALLGIKEPEAISKIDALEYLLKNKIDTSNTIFLKENYFDTLLTRPFKPQWEKGLRPIQFKVFDKDGILVSQYSSCEGPLKYTNYTGQFPPTNISPIDTTYTLKLEQEITSGIISNIGDNDYITIIYWATFTGIPGRKLIQKIENEIRMNGIKSAIFKLNVDPTGS